MARKRLPGQRAAHRPAETFDPPPRGPAAVVIRRDQHDDPDHEGDGESTEAQAAVGHSSGNVRSRRPRLADLLGEPEFRSVTQALNELPGLAGWAIEFQRAANEANTSVAVRLAQELLAEVTRGQWPTAQVERVLQELSALVELTLPGVDTEAVQLRSPLARDPRPAMHKAHRVADVLREAGVDDVLLELLRQADPARLPDGVRYLMELLDQPVVAPPDVRDAASSPPMRQEGPGPDPSRFGPGPAGGPPGIGP